MVPQNFEESTGNLKEDENSIPQADRTEADSAEYRPHRLRWVLYALLAIPVLYVAIGLSLRFLITSERTRIRNNTASELRSSLDYFLIYERHAQFFIGILHLQKELPGFPDATTGTSPNATPSKAMTYPMTFVQQFKDTQGRHYSFLLRRYTAKSELTILSIEESVDGITWSPSEIPIPSEAAQESASQMARNMAEGSAKILAKTIKEKLLPADK